MTGPEQAEFYERAAAVGDEPATEYGFVGRDLDIQAIEHRSSPARTPTSCWSRAWPGPGSPRCWRTWPGGGSAPAWSGQVFRFSYEDRAWTAGQIIRDIRARLLSPAEHAQADTMIRGRPRPSRSPQLLRATRHLLILDNTESITAAPAAIPHALSPGEQHKLKTFLARLRGGRTLVLLGSREAEAWLDRRQHRARHLPAARPGPASRLRAGRPDPAPATTPTAT